MNDERQRLLELTARHLLAHGVLDLRLRTLAEAIGTSHRVLLYYFESREELVTLALDEAARITSVRDASLLGPSGTDPDVEGELVRVWLLISGPEQLPLMRLFFQVVAIAIHEPQRYADFLGALHTEWIDAYVAYFEAHGLPRRDAEDLSAEIIGLQRGLQFELAVGGSNEQLDRSYRAAARRWGERVAHTASTPRA